MKGYLGACILFFLLASNSPTPLISQSAHLYDLGVVGSLIDNGGIFPQEKGLEYGLQMRSGISLVSDQQTQVDLSYSRLQADLNVYMIALRHNLRKEKSLWSPTIGYINLSPFKSYLLGLDYEFYANDLMTLTTGALYEIKNLDDNHYYWDFSFMLYFTDQLMLRSGIAYTGTSIKRPLFEAILAFEYAPEFIPVSFFFKLGNELVYQNQFGFKYNFENLGTLKNRHRQINVSSRFF